MIVPLSIVRAAVFGCFDWLIQAELALELEPGLSQLLPRLGFILSPRLSRKRAS